MTTTLTLSALQTSARNMGLCGAWVVNIGLHVKPTYSGPMFLVTLDDGTESGTTWTVGLADGSEDSGELPVTSDADQTMRDAMAWMNGQRVLPD